MKKSLALLALALLLTLSSCVLIAQESDQPPEGALALCFAVADERQGDAAVDWEYRLPDTEQEPVPALIAALLAGPERLDLSSPFPAGVRLRAWTLGEDGGLRLDFTESYADLSGIDLTLANYCLALTLCQLEEVEYLHITVAGEELPFWRSATLRPEDVILSGAEEQPVTVNIALYFPRTAAGSLGVEYRDVLVTEADILAGVVMDAYMAGPTYQSLRAVLPQGTELLGVTLEGGICYVNFSQAFLDAAPTGAEARGLVYSIVNTVGSLEKVEAVQLQVEGENLTVYGGLPVTALKPDLTLES